MRSNLARAPAHRCFLVVTGGPMASLAQQASGIAGLMRDTSAGVLPG